MKAYVAIESFIWKGGVVINPDDEIQLADHDARYLIHQGRVVLKAAPVVETEKTEPQGEAETQTRGRRRGN